MSADPATLVENTWAIASKQPDFTDRFYDRLFVIRPDFKTTLFGRTNIKAQAKMLASMLDVAIQNLRNTSVLVPTLQELGMRHCKYGIRPEDYPAVGEALLWTLEQSLGSKWTPEVKAAWVGVYTTVQTVMASQCETEEGKRLLAEYEAKYPRPTKAAAAKCACNSWMCYAVIAIPVVVAGLYFLNRRRNESAGTSTTVAVPKRK